MVRSDWLWGVLVLTCLQSACESYGVSDESLDGSIQDGMAQEYEFDRPGADWGCPVCLTEEVKFGYDGGDTPVVETFQLTPCSSLAAERSDRGNQLLLRCVADVGSCSSQKPKVTSYDLAEAFEWPGVKEAFTRGSILYGIDSRPVDGAVFAISKKDGGSWKEVLLGDPCPPVPGDCQEAPDDLLELKGLLVHLIEQVPDYPDEDCQKW